MLGNYDLIDKINAEYGDKVACISIGQAGEMKMAAATVAFTDMEQRPTRHAGRGGVGAVMGAKGVKVIVLDDTDMPTRSPKDPEKLKEPTRRLLPGLKNTPLPVRAFPASEPTF
jgi:aldehyde:ferredoxin oxidoreductase